MIDELVFNLCEKAVKYNVSGGQVNVDVKCKGKDVLLSIKDTGIGISKDEQNRIFERFYRVDKSHSDKVGGTGLGLAIVKHILEYHDASISLSSKLGEGSEFVVKFTNK